MEDEDDESFWDHLHADDDSEWRDYIKGWLDGLREWRLKNSSAIELYAWALDLDAWAERDRAWAGRVRAYADQDRTPVP